MNWKKKFRDLILERGRNYYKRNRVCGLSYRNNIYTARVLGSHAYDVEIKIREDDIVYMKCSCPYAVSGLYCKHMAAVMYAIDEEGEELRQETLDLGEKNVQPFTVSKDTYQYYDMGRIAGDLEFSERRYEDAKQLILENKVALDKVEIGYHRFIQGVMQCGVAYGYYQDDRYPRQIKFTFTRDELIQGSCGVMGCGGRYENAYYYSTKIICKHMLALMLLLDEYLKKYNPGDSTDEEGRAFVNAFRNMHYKDVLGEQTEEVNDFVMEPVLERYGNALSLTCRAGLEKLYVVKNLTEFVEQYENKDIVRFGTKTEIDLAKHRISDSSKALYEYVRQIVKEEEHREEYLRMRSNYYYTEEIKNQIRVYGDRLDKFYALYEGQSVACNDKSKGKTVKTRLKFQEGKPNIQIDVEPDIDQENIFHGVYVTGQVPDFIRGSRSSYYFSKDTLCRINDDVTREIQPLLDVGEYGNFDFCVGRKNLSEFYHQILPVLKQNVTVNEVEKEAIQEYIPPEAVFAFYLDAEKGNVTCKPKARYGEKIVSLIDNFRGDYVYEDFRNLNLEDEVLYHLHEYFSEVDMENDEIHCGSSEDAILHLLDGGVERLMALGEVHTTDRFRSVNIRKLPKVKVGVSIESDIMNLSVSSEDIDQEELLQILQNYKRKKKYYRLRNGEFVSVEETDIELLSQMMETLQLSPKEFVKGNMKVPMYRALYLNKMLEQSEHIYLNRDKHFRNLIKEFKTLEESDFEVPDSLSSVMRNYQVQGFHWMKTLEQYGFGGILADDMGLGKTLQMISVLQDAKEKEQLGTALIVSPASLVYNWKEELAKFAPKLNVTLVVGHQDERADIIRHYQESDVLVTSYDLLKRDIAEYEDVKFNYQVLDEAQYIKNHSTAAAKSVKLIHSKHRYALTGTPIENRLSELWSIFDYLMPGFLYGYETFRKQLETPIVKHKDEAASERLKKMVAPFILRRLKGDVLKDLPDKMEEVRYARFEVEQQQLYDAQVVHMRNVVANQDAEDFEKNKLQILAELTKIRQICCDPELLFEKYTGGSAKRLACIELIHSAIEGEHKMLVFSQFTSMLELLEQDLKKQNIRYYKITGATPKENRMEMVSAFNTDDTPVFLISLKAGGTGLNLTGADVVIHYDPWWNQAVQNQATDRAHRIGQTKVVSVYKLIAKETIEEKIVKMQESKRDLADSILSGETGSITRMSKEELLELLEV